MEKTESRRNSFGPKDAGSLVENNVIIFGALPIVEQAFESSVRSLFEFGDDWQMHATRATLTFLSYNLIKFATLWFQSEDDRSSLRRFGEWLWVQLFGE